MSSPISGFTAIPNPQMLAFMPIQSYLMMYFAGAGWQIGKRKISAIPNEEFNKMSANDLLKGFTADLRETIPTMESSLQDVSPLIRVLIEQYGDFIREAIAATPQAISNIFGGESESTLRGKLAALGATSALGVGARLDNKLIDKIMAAIVASKNVAASTIAEAKASTIPGLTVQQAQEAARLRQIAHEKAQRLAADAHARLVSGGTITTPTPQVPVGLVQTKRAAGQSQRIERTRLINEIGKKATVLKQMIALNRSGKTAAPAGDITRVKKEMFDLQQKMVNLLARYQF